MMGDIIGDLIRALLWTLGIAAGVIVVLLCVIGYLVFR